MSRAEIAAAVAAYRAARASATPGTAGLIAGVPTIRFDRLVEEFAESVAERPTYRAWLVARLHDRICAGTYRASAEAIVEQMLGRLVAAALPH